MPRPKRNTDGVLPYQHSNLKLTNQYFARYEAIDAILRASPRIVDLVHQDLKDVLTAEEMRSRKKFQYATDTVLRVMLVQDIESLTLRSTVVRIDDSTYLRRFTRINDGPMMDYTTLCRLRNEVKDATWKKINRCLARSAVEQDQITGDSLRLDTTAVETNIHYPTDSSLLYDVARTLGRLLDGARDLDSNLLGSRRVHLRPIRRRTLKITRMAAKKGRTAESLKPLYEAVLNQVGGILDLGAEVQRKIEDGEVSYSKLLDECLAEELARQLGHFIELGRTVVDQARRRVVDGDKVPNAEKLFSIFEEHTELLKRGKAGKDIEFGHMIQIQQVKEKFITDYEVFDVRPVEHQLLEPALRSHRDLFGADPERFTADKGYYESMDAIHRLEERIPVVGIGKKGKRNAEETAREADPLFRLAQQFRAGVEGSISFLKRCLGLFRVLRRGWEHFQAAVGESVFAHNLLVLSRL